MINQVFIIFHCHTLGKKSYQNKHTFYPKHNNQLVIKICIHMFSQKNKTMGVAMENMYKKSHIYSYSNFLISGNVLNS